MKEEHQKIYKKLEPMKSIDIEKAEDTDELVTAMGKTAFSGRALGEALEVLWDMVNDKNCLKVLTLSGAMTMAKMGLIITQMIEKRIIDAVVSTGAIISHGFIESAGLTHFKNPGNISDEKLRELRLDRVYDTLESESNFDEADKIVTKVLEAQDTEKTLCSHVLVRELGKYLYENVKGKSIFSAAYKNNVPIFIPAFTDCEMGLDFALYNRKQKMAGRRELQFNPFLDLEKYSDMVTKAEKTGILTLGGGVPRNWAQQVAPFLDIYKYRILAGGDEKKYEAMDAKDEYYKPFWYGVRICPEPVHWGGLSGCTYSEGVSWGKFVPRSQGGKMAEVFADATIGFPVLMKALFERMEKNNIKL
ncbi:deoxyhypusine synthase [Candidatus Parcubacteria bacterium]|nr:MAG: deoxyhypusine synthase [Candidatus Parcubacteria bacterium]